MTTMTMTATPSAVTHLTTNAVKPVVTTAARFVGHFLAALVGVTFLGRDLEH
ncbi:hypothetical protein [Saccharothrix sp. NRRL B-16348]|uniref:hypothetical protein n=1 Tax=Saccharothrix sp. NRRL B-16348 TaxID=1415542 RepID=UPI000A5C6D78|nr:hypothetical protein [Saccharothrix sp. NRRL B-16348]